MFVSLFVRLVGFFGWLVGLVCFVFGWLFVLFVCCLVSLIVGLFVWFVCLLVCWFD